MLCPPRPCVHMRTTPSSRCGTCTLDRLDRCIDPPAVCSLPLWSPPMRTVTCASATRSFHSLLLLLALGDRPGGCHRIDTTSIRSGQPGKLSPSALALRLPMATALLNAAAVQVHEWSRRVLPHCGPLHHSYDSVYAKAPLSSNPRYPKQRVMQEVHYVGVRQREVPPRALQT